MSIENIFLTLGFILSVFATIATGITAYFVNRQGLTDDALAMYQHQRTIADEQNKKIQVQDDRISIQSKRIDNQDKKIAELENELHELKIERGALTRQLKDANIRIDELEIENNTVNQRLSRMASRFAQMKELLIHTHEVALKLVDQLINEHNTEPALYPPKIDQFLRDVE